MPGVEQFDIEIFLLAIVAFKQETVGQPGAEGFIAFVEIGGGQGGELLNQPLDLLFGDAVGLIAGGEVMAKIVFDNHLIEAGTRDIIADQVLIALIL